MDIITGLLTAGALGTVLTAALALVRIAIGAERRRADDWRTAYNSTTAANAILGSQVEKLITSVEHLSTAQREMMTVLQTMTADRRGAA